MLRTTEPGNGDDARIGYGRGKVWRISPLQVVTVTFTETGIVTVAAPVHSPTHNMILHARCGLYGGSCPPKRSGKELSIVQL